MSTFVIPIHEITESGKDVSFAIPIRWIDEVMADADLRGVEGEEGRVSLRAHRVDEDIAITGQVTAPLLTPCVRCLEDVRLDADTKMRVVLSPRSAAAELPEELELTPEDLDREYHDGDVVRLDDIVRELLILEVPMQPLCSEACKGIAIPDHVKAPDDFGAVDPRLAPLMKLKGELPEGTPKP